MFRDLCVMTCLNSLLGSFRVESFKYRLNSAEMTESARPMAYSFRKFGAIS
jgi:hypothetical protein